ncbi:metal-dependent hydrolase [Paenibacillus massiliensis]|uniref:metal-dependent hydrolase n=1 Tax=Paenibacillus massiliensis TaxID=225917 RepID=UPI00037299CD|nr:metal-dependent hydrolase [Paenibacillus massiliensis]
MMGRAHIIIGTGVSWSVLVLQGYDVTLPAAAAAVIGSLLPDIDEPNSLLLSRTMPRKLLRWVQILTLIGAVIVFMAGVFSYPWDWILAGIMAVVAWIPSRSLRKVILFALGAGFAWYGGAYSPWNYIAGSLLVICTIVPHRGLTHTLYGAAAWTGLLYGTTAAYGDSIWLAGGIAYVVHLLADSLTNNGIKPLPPLNLRLRFRLMSTGTKKGARVENICIALTLLLVTVAYIFRSV